MGPIQINRDCPMCGTKHFVIVPSEAYYKWINKDMYIQDAFPNLSATEREQLLSGLCPRCQDKVFD